MQGDASSITSDSILNDDDLNEGDDDEFGMETGGWCCFTNSLPITYLRMWLNDKPNTSFIIRQIPQDVQLDTANAMASKERRASDTSTSNNNGKSQKKSPNEAIADAIIGYIKVKEAEVVNPRNMTDALGVELQSFMQSQSAKEKIVLLENQISVVARRLEQSQTNEHCENYSAALQKLEKDLDDLVFPNSG
jgi:hypothetical protein